MPYQNGVSDEDRKPGGMRQNLSMRSAGQQQKETDNNSNRLKRHYTDPNMKRTRKMGNGSNVFVTNEYNEFLNVPSTARDRGSPSVSSFQSDPESCMDGFMDDDSDACSLIAEGGGASVPPTEEVHERSEGAQGSRPLMTTLNSRRKTSQRHVTREASIDDPESTLTSRNMCTFENGVIVASAFDTFEKVVTEAREDLRTTPN